MYSVLYESKPFYHVDNGNNLTLIRLDPFCGWVIVSFSLVNVETRD